MWRRYVTDLDTYLLVYYLLLQHFYSLIASVENSRVLRLIIGYDGYKT